MTAKGPNDGGLVGVPEARKASPSVFEHQARPPSRSLNRLFFPDMRPPWR